MTTVYFIRHAEPNYQNHDDLSRELTAKGLKDREKVSAFLEERRIDVALSSPYKRAIDTIKEYTDAHGLTIGIEDDFRERKIGSGWIEDFTSFAQKQWDDFTYKLSDGESLKEVQERNIGALKKVLTKYPGKNMIIGSHGTALSTIINYYDHSFGYSDFNQIKNKMPFIVEFVFDEEENFVRLSTYSLEE